MSDLKRVDDLISRKTAKEAFRDDNVGYDWSISSIEAKLDDIPTMYFEPCDFCAFRPYKADKDPCKDCPAMPDEG